MFYNPCLGVNCVTGPAGANEYGPGGAPYIDAFGGPLLSDAGVTAVDTWSRWVVHPERSLEQDPADPY